MPEYTEQLLSMGVDVSSALPRFAGKEEIFLKFLFSLPEEPSIPDYKSALAAGNNAEAERCVHSFKGIAGNLGLDKLYDMASKLVTMFRKDELRELDEKNAELYSEYDRVCTEIKRLRSLKS